MPVSCVVGLSKSGKDAVIMFTNSGISFSKVDYVWQVGIAFSADEMSEHLIRVTDYDCQLFLFEECMNDLLGTSHSTQL